MVLDPRLTSRADALLVRISKGPHCDGKLGLTLVDIPWCGVVVIRDVGAPREGCSPSKHVHPGDALLSVNGKDVRDVNAATVLLEEAFGTVELCVAPLRSVRREIWNGGAPAQPGLQSEGASSGTQRSVNTSVLDWRGLNELTDERTIMLRKPMRVHPAAPKWLTCELARPNHKETPWSRYGIALGGNLDGAPSIFHLRPGSIAARCGQLRPGDVVTSVNGEAAEDFLSACEQIRNSKEVLVLSIRRPEQDDPTATDLGATPAPGAHLIRKILRHVRPPLPPRPEEPSDVSETGPLPMWDVRASREQTGRLNEGREGVHSTAPPRKGGTSEA